MKKPMMILSGFMLAAVMSAPAAAAGAAEPAVQDVWADALKVMNDLNSPVLDGLSNVEAQKKWGAKSAQYWDWYDRLRTLNRVKGLQAWSQAPDDPRRYGWLVTAVQLSPYYWKDREQGANAYAAGYYGKVAMDEQAREQWLRDYLPLRNELLLTADAATRDSLRAHELMASIWRLQHLRDDNRDRFDDPVMSALYVELKERLIGDVLDLAIQNPASGYAARVAYWLLMALDRDMPATRSLLAAMLQSPGEDMRALARGRSQVVKLQETPFQFKGPTLQGGTVDFTQLRGRIVFVDIWSNYCATCIEMMPKVQEIYARYRSQGVEVLGIWCDTADKRGLGSVASAADRKTALAHLRRNGVTYPNALLGGEACRQFEQEYWIPGYPVTWLFDREGRWVTANLTGPRLEAEILALIGKDPGGALR